MQSSLKHYALILLVFILLGCNVQPTQVTPPPVATATQPPVEETPANQLTILEGIDPYYLPVNAMPNLWTKIDKDKITIYPQNWLVDYTYDKDGGVWVAGGFGVIHKEANGKQTWYSMKNGLPANDFSAVAISPKGEVWIGGADNALLRFDGAGWLDEGSKLPPPQDSFSDWLCYSKNIVGIDFDQDGSTWVMNAGIELYTQAYGQWVNFPFPKNILPYAGGGACPQGMRVKSENDITIKRQGCCANPPSAYHYDGKTWSENSDFAEVDALLTARRTAPGPLTYAGYNNWLSTVSQGTFLPDDLRDPLSFDDTLLTADQNGVIWIKDGSDLYNNATGSFQRYAGNGVETNSEAKNSALLNFGSAVFYRQDGKKPLALWQALEQAKIDGADPQYPGVDPQKRVWFYDPQKGLGVMDDGNVNLLGATPELSFAKIGRVLPLRDGRALVGSAGVLWLFDGKGWQEFALPGKDELFSYLGEDQQGMIYAASDTSVYKIDLQNKNFSASIFVLQGIKPVIVPLGGEPDGCTFRARYNSLSNCFGLWKDASANTHYTIKLFSLQDDGAMYYVSNKIVAKFENGTWKSFLFDTINIEAATIDKDHAIWLYTGRNGLIRLAPDIFTAYQDIPAQ